MNGAADIERCHKLLDDVNVPDADDGTLSGRLAVYIKMHSEIDDMIGENNGAPPAR